MQQGHDDVRDQLRRTGELLRRQRERVARRARLDDELRALQQQALPWRQQIAVALDRVQRGWLRRWWRQLRGRGATSHCADAQLAAARRELAYLDARIAALQGERAAVFVDGAAIERLERDYRDLVLTREQQLRQDHPDIALQLDKSAAGLRAIAHERDAIDAAVTAGLEAVRVLELACEAGRGTVPTGLLEAACRQLGRFAGLLGDDAAALAGLDLGAGLPPADLRLALPAGAHSGQRHQDLHDRLRALLDSVRAAVGELQRRAQRIRVSEARAIDERAAWIEAVD